MTSVDYQVLSKFVDIDERDLEFHKITNAIKEHDIEHGIEVIFDYYRRHGFQHYKIR